MSGANPNPFKLKIKFGKKPAPPSVGPPQAPVPPVPIPAPASVEKKRKRPEAELLPTGPVPPYPPASSHAADHSTTGHAKKKQATGQGHSSMQPPMPPATIRLPTIKFKPPVSLAGSTPAPAVQPPAPPAPSPSVSRKNSKLHISEPPGMMQQMLMASPGPSGLPPSVPKPGSGRGSATPKSQKAETKSLAAQIALEVMMSQQPSPPTPGSGKGSNRLGPPAPPPAPGQSSGTPSSWHHPPSHTPLPPPSAPSSVPGALNHQAPPEPPSTHASDFPQPPRPIHNSHASATAHAQAVRMKAAARAHQHGLNQQQHGPGSHPPGQGGIGFPNPVPRPKLLLRIKPSLAGPPPGTSMPLPPMPRPSAIDMPPASLAVPSVPGLGGPRFGAGRGRGRGPKRFTVRMNGPSMHHAGGLGPAPSMSLRTASLGSDGGYEPGSSGQRSEPEVPPDRMALERVLNLIQQKDSENIFKEPVTEQLAPGYFEMISKPMDFTTMRAKLERGEYTTWDSMQDDLNTMFKNCMLYNGPTSWYYQVAESLMARANVYVEKARTGRTDFRGCGAQLTRQMNAKLAAEKAREAELRAAEARAARAAELAAQQRDDSRPTNRKKKGSRPGFIAHRIHNVLNPIHDPSRSAVGPGGRSLLDENPRLSYKRKATSSDIFATSWGGMTNGATAEGVPYAAGRPVLRALAPANLLGATQDGYARSISRFIAGCGASVRQHVLSSMLADCVLAERKKPSAALVVPAPVAVPLTPAPAAALPLTPGRGALPSAGATAAMQQQAAAVAAASAAATGTPAATPAAGPVAAAAAATAPVLPMLPATSGPLAIAPLSSLSPEVLSALAKGGPLSTSTLAALFPNLPLPLLQTLQNTPIPSLPTLPLPALSSLAGMPPLTSLLPGLFGAPGALGTPGAGAAAPGKAPGTTPAAAAAGAPRTASTSSARPTQPGAAAPAGALLSVPAPAAGQLLASLGLARAPSPANSQAAQQQQATAARSQSAGGAPPVPAPSAMPQRMVSPPLPGYSQQPQVPTAPAAPQPQQASYHQPSQQQAQATYQQPAAQHLGQAQGMSAQPHPQLSQPVPMLVPQPYTAHTPSLAPVSMPSVPVHMPSAVPMPTGASTMAVTAPATATGPGGVDEFDLRSGSPGAADADMMMMELLGGAPGGA